MRRLLNTSFTVCSIGCAFAIATCSGLLSGCDGTEHSIGTGVTGDTLVLRTDWPFFGQWSGVFVDPATGKELIFSGDPNTHKKVRVFDPSGKALYDIPLGEALEALGDLDSFTLLSHNRLFALQAHGDGFVVLDTMGRIEQHHSLSASLCHTGIDRYSLTAHGNGPCVLGNSVFVGASWYGPCNEPPDAPFDPLAYYSVETGKCKVARIDAAKPSTGVSFGGCDILRHLGNGTFNTISATGVTVIGGRLFIVNPYLPDIIELDSASLRVKKRFPIRYMKGSVGIRPPIASPEDEARRGDNIRLGTKPYVLTMGYDAPSGRTLATIAHEIPEEALSKQPRGSRDWSLLVLDSMLIPVGEHVFSGTEHRGTYLLSLNSGSWVLRTTKGIKAATEPKVFDRLRIP
jgi:hypothetical protein